MHKKQHNFKAFIPIGITFIGSGVVFITSVNPVIGTSLITIGIVWVILGVKNRKENNIQKD